MVACFFFQIIALPMHGSIAISNLIRMAQHVEIWIRSVYHCLHLHFAENAL